MKKLAFPLAVVILVALLAALVGYDTLMTRNESQDLATLNDTPTEEVVEEEGPTIYCIGDSLTLDTDVKSYAAFLSEITGYQVETFGGMQDTSEDIAIRMGAIPIYAADLTIPQDTEPVALTIYDENHEPMDVLLHEGSNFKEVEIAGVQGTLTYDEQDETHYFTRLTQGEEVVISDYTQIRSDFPEFKENSIAVIFTGTYDPNVSMGIFDTINDQYRIQEALHTENYIVVSLTSRRTFSIVGDMNQVMAENFGDHFLDFRSYVLENGLQDANLTPTAQDEEDLSHRYIPSSLLQDDLIDGNEAFNQLLANQLASKMVELGYLQLPTEE